MLSIIFWLLMPETSIAVLPDVRPIPSNRTFISSSIDNLIEELVPLMLDRDVATLFSNCLPNTLDTTVAYSSQSSDDTNYTNLDTFIITGDIYAMWLRDSTNQVLPYLPYVTQDSQLQMLFEGLIARQARSIVIDPYANSFNFNNSGDGHQTDKRTPPMTAPVFEGKYEIDSLCAFLKLSYWYWRYGGDESLLSVITVDWLKAVKALLSTGNVESYHYSSIANFDNVLENSRNNANRHRKIVIATIFISTGNNRGFGYSYFTRERSTC
jgi:hypothetical protein